MYKKIISLILMSMMIFSLLPFGAAAEEAEEEVKIFYSDLTYDSGSIKSSDYIQYSANTKKGYGLSVIKDDDTENNVLKLEQKRDDDTIGAGNKFQLLIPGSLLNDIPMSGKVVLEFDMKYKNMASTFMLFVMELVTGNTSLVGPIVDEAGNVKINNETLPDKMLLDVWYNIKCVINIEEENSQMYIDDNLIFERELEGLTKGGIRYCTLPKSTNLREDIASVLYMDNIKLYNIPGKYSFTTFKKIGETETEGLDAFPLSGGVAKVTFSEKMNELKKEDFEFTADGQSIDFDFSCDEDGKSVYFAPKVSFKGREECKISFENIKTSYGTGAKYDTFTRFTVVAPKYGVAEVSLGELVPGTTNEVSVYIQNHTEKDEKGIVLMGFYKEGRLISVSLAEGEFPVNAESNKDVTVSIEVPEDYSEENYDVYTYLLTSDNVFARDFSID